MGKELARIRKKLAQGTTEPLPIESDKKSLRKLAESWGVVFPETSARKDPNDSAKMRRWRKKEAKRLERRLAHRPDPRYAEMAEADRHLESIMAGD